MDCERLNRGKNRSGDRSDVVQGQTEELGSINGAAVFDDGKPGIEEHLTRGHSGASHVNVPISLY